MGTLLYNFLYIIYYIIYCHVYMFISIYMYNLVRGIINARNESADSLHLPPSLYPAVYIYFLPNQDHQVYLLPYQVKGTSTLDNK